MQGLLIFRNQFSFSIFYMSKEEKRNDRFESYPRLSETDKQLKNQSEFEDQQPNEFNDKSVSDVPDNEEKDNRIIREEKKD